MAETLLSKIAGMVNRTPTDVVGLDFASSGLRAVRLRKSVGKYQLMGAEVFPAVPVQAVMEEGGAAVADGFGQMTFPPQVRGRYAALLVPGTHAVVKLLRVSDKLDLADRENVMARLGFPKAEGYRLELRVIQPATPRMEAQVLAVTLPDRQAEAVLQLLPPAGWPAPRTIEVSELAVVNAFQLDPRFAGREKAYGLIHFDQDFSLVALFNRGYLSQLRTFPFGMAAVLRKLVKVLNVDELTAEGVLTDGAFDISHLIDEDARSLHGQFVISRDYMERTENCSLEELYVSGPAALARPFTETANWPGEMQEWNALAGFRNGDQRAGSEPPDPWRFSAAVGGCLGMLEGT